MIRASEWDMLEEMIQNGTIPSFHTKREAKDATRQPYCGFALKDVIRVSRDPLYGRVWVVGKKLAEKDKTPKLDVNKIECSALKYEKNENGEKTEITHVFSKLVNDNPFYIEPINSK